MATGVNVKMGVSGVAQFKQGMKESQAAVKNLDQQLKLNEQQLKLNGDAEVYLQNKTKLLEEQIAKQKEVCKNAQNALEAMRKNGVAETSAEFQRMQQQMYKASTDLMAMQTDLQNVGIAGDDAANGVSEMNAQLKRVGDGVNYQNVTEGLKSITDGMQKVVAKAWQMGEAIVQATLGAGSWADELKTTSDQYKDTLNAFGGGDSATEALQRMRKTARLIDTDVDTILTAQDKLKKGREGQGKEFMGALAYLGIDPTGTSDLDLFWEVGEAIQKLGDEEDKVTYAQRLFGKSWRELLPLFNAGREEYEKTYNSWNVVEDEQIDKLGEMDDQYVKMTEAWETFKMEMLSAFSGPLTQGMETITGLFEELNKYLDTPEGKEMLNTLGNTISGLITDLTNIDPAEVVGGLQSVINGITDAFKWIDEHHEDVVTAMKMIVAGWAGLKLAGGAADVLKLINGIRGLTGSSAVSAAEAAGKTVGSSWATGLGTAATAVLLGFPIIKRIMEEGWGFLNPADEQYDTVKQTANTLDTINPGTGAIYEKVMTEGLAKPKSNDLPEVSPFAENLQDYYPDAEYQKSGGTRPHKSVGFVGRDLLTSGEPANANFVVEDIDDFITAEDKMTQTAGEMTDETAKMRLQNHELTHAAMELTALPDQMLEKVKQAIMDGMSTVTIVIGEDAVDTIGNNVIKKSGTLINALVP